jgi:hypothetical protein
METKVEGISFIFSWKQRLVDEEKELKGKIEKLLSFLESEEFLTLLEREQELLIKQANAMEDYLHILTQRIEYLFSTQEEK